MGEPFVETQIPKTVGPAAKQKPSAARGVMGWVLFFSAAVLMFMYLNSQPTPQSGPSPQSPPVPWSTGDSVAVSMLGLGVAIYVGGFAWLIRRGRRGRIARIIRWHFDESGIYTDYEGSEHYSPWEWVASVTPSQGGLLVDRGVTGVRLFPDAAFSTPAERQAFLDTFSRRGMPMAKEVEYAGPRGFEI